MEEKKSDMQVSRYQHGVLIADDHAVVRLALAQVFEDWEEFSLVGTAYDGQDAVEKAAITNPEVIIMDVMMPGMTGSEATTMIKKADPDVIVIGMSAQDNEDVRADMMTAGADAFISKDVLTDDLRRMVTMLLAK